MPVRLHRLTQRLGVQLDELTSTHLQQLCDMRMPEDVDLDYKSQDAYSTSGQDGLDELAKDVTALANTRGGLIVVGLAEDAQGGAATLTKVPVSDKKINQMLNGLRARVFPWHHDIAITNLEDPEGSGGGYVLIAVGTSAMAPHAVRMTSKPHYAFARRVGRSTAWLEESEIAAFYRDRFRLAEDHRDLVLKVLEDGAAWHLHSRSSTQDRIWLEIALVPSVPAERFVDSAHLADVAAFFKDYSAPAVAPRPVLGDFAARRPEVLRGRLRFEPYADPTACEAYADGRVYLRSEVGLFGPNGPVLYFTGLEYWLLVLLCAAAQYASWAGAYGDVDVVARLVGPRAIATSTAPLAGDRVFPSISDPRERTDVCPVHATSTLDALTADGAQLVGCARRIAADLLADFGQVETTLLRPNGEILTPRLDREARTTLETWMRRVGLLER